MSGQAESSVADSEGPAPSGVPASRLRRRAALAVAAWLAFVAVGQVMVWLVLPMPHGRSIPWMVTCAMGLVTLLLVAAWLLFIPPYGRRLSFPVALVLYLGAIGAVAGSIREVHFTGDMKPSLTFRWQPTAEERLRAFRSRAAEPAERAPSKTEIDWTPAADDMPDFRGPHRDGVVASPPFSDDWGAHPPHELWRRPCGEGYASFAVVGPAAVTIEQRGPNEAVVCYDVDTGRERWVHEYPASFFEGMGGPGPRATPTISGTDVLALGALGHLTCIDLSTGTPRWHVNILTENGLVRGGEPFNAVWAMSGAPLVVDEKVIVNAGGPVGDGLVAYDRHDGAVIWKGAGLKDPVVTESSVNRAGYSSPQLATLLGERQILIFDGVGLRSCAVETGEQLWFYKFEHGESPGRVNVAQPLILDGDRVFISASYARGCDMLRISRDEGGAWSATSVWDDSVKRNMRCKFSSPVLHEGHIYGLDEGMLTCLDAQTGRRTWKRDRRAQYGHGQMLLVNDRIVLLSEYGELVLIDPSPEGLRELAKFPVLPGEKTWNPPALARGRAVLRNHIEAVCLELPRLSGPPADYQRANR